MSAPLGVEELTLDNGMRLLLLRRPSMPTVEAGWIVAAGSANDPPDATGLSHFIEHMMFKGSRTIGAVNSTREAQVLERLATIEDELAGLPATGRKAGRRRNELATERQRLEREADSLTRLGAFSFEYSRVGATRLNANTAEDATLYYVTLPAEVLELWFWLESDRLLYPVFREFDKEKRVVAEERRQRIASTPTGTADRMFEQAFWRGTPYAQPALGTAEHVEAMTRRRLASFFDRHYRPGAITAVLVGNFDPQRVRALASTYFGRLPSQPLQSEAYSGALQRSAEEVLDQTCRCAPRAKVRYPTVELGHGDQVALQLVAGLLNGRSGRLYRNLVLGQELAFAAYAQQTPLRHSGAFTVTLEAKAGIDLVDLLGAWDREVASLLAEPPTDSELMRVRRRLATEHLDQLKDPHLLMRRLLVYAGLGDWRHLAGWTQELRAIDPARLRAVIERYLTPERRLVGYYRSSGDAQ